MRWQELWKKRLSKGGFIPSDNREIVTFTALSFLVKKILIVSRQDRKEKTFANTQQQYSSRVVLSYVASNVETFQSVKM